MSLSSDSLAFALTGAARALLEVDNGSALPRALSMVFQLPAMKADMTAGARGAIQDLSYRSMRQWGMACALLELLTDKPLTDARLRSLLRCALALLSEPVPAYAAHTLVDQAVNAASADPELLRAKGLVNAVLRRFLREKTSLIASAGKQEQALWNYPQWWINKTRKIYPQQWQAILGAGNIQAPLTLRVNTRKISVADYLAALAQHAMPAQTIGPVAVRLERAVPVNQLPGFSGGWVSVQDAAAQLAAPLLDVADGMRVLDACAAPGGKTGHLLELAALDLLALDQDAERLERVAQNLNRLELNAKLVQGDARQRDWWDGQPFDRILADVPCTASGIVRRHPDIRWLRRPEDAAKLAALSASLLDNLWGMLRPGGKLLLVTCSLWPEESIQQAERFATRHSVIRLDAPGQLLPAANQESAHDGLFYSLLQKPPV